MSQARQAVGTVIGFQMESRPVANRAAATCPTEDGGLRVTVPFRRVGWARWLRPILRLSESRNVQLDALGAEVFSRCDGRNTVADIVAWFQERWQLSFFEARGMALHFLRQLMRRGLIAIVAPPEKTRGHEE